MTLKTLNGKNDFSFMFLSNEGVESKCELFSIWHDNSPPSSPSGLTHLPSSEFTSETPQFSWTMPMPELQGSGLSYYEATIGDSPGADFANISGQWIKIDDPTILNKSIFNSELQTSLQADKTYYISIRAVDFLGNTSNQTTSAGWTINRAILGQLDTSFSGDGITVFSGSATVSSDSAWGLDFDSLGRVIVQGVVKNSTSAAGTFYDGFLLRIIPENGNLDTTFNTTGSIMVHYNAYDLWYGGVSVKDDDTFIVGGNHEMGGADLGPLHYNPSNDGTNRPIICVLA